MADTVAPVAPAPAPAPPAPAPTPTPAPAPAPAPQGTPSGGDPNPFDAEVDKAMERVEGTPFPAAPDAPAKPAAAAPPAKPAPAKPAPASKPGKPAADIAKVPPQFRQEYDKLKADHTSLNEKYSTLEKKIAEFEAKGKDTEALTGRLQSLEKAITDKDAELRMLKQESSPEFKEKWDKPFDQQAAYAQSIVEQLEVAQEDGTTRKATWEDFIELYRTPPGKVAAKATAMFGDSASQVVGFWNSLKELDYRRSNALKEERAQAATRIKEEEGRLAQTREQFNSLWERVNKELSETVDDYRDTPDDKEAAALRQKAATVFDSEPKTAREQIVKNAHIRQRVLAFGPMQLKLKRLEAKIAELEAGGAGGGDPSDPSRTRHPGGEPQAQATEDWEADARNELNQV